MRRLVTVVASLAVISLLVPSVGQAIDPPQDADVGVLCIFTHDVDQLASATNVVETVVLNTPIDLYWCIWNEKTPSGNLGGIEYSWRFDPAPPVAPFVLVEEWPAGALNIGTTYNPVVGMGAGLPTTDDHVRFLHMQIMFIVNPGTTAIYVGPSVPDSIDGYAVYNDFSSPELLFPMAVNSNEGSYNYPVFGFNMPVATESQTWGTVKALFE